MTTTPPDDDPAGRLDPDQVECPACEVPPSVPCTTPSGRRARTVHTARRNVAAGEAPDKRPAPRKSPATPEGRSRAGKVTAARRQERRALLDAEKERLLGEYEREAIRDHADRLARDAASWDHKRMLLRNLVIDRTYAAWQLADPAQLRRPLLDEHGERALVVDDATGQPGPAEVGYLEAAELRHLTWVAGVMLDKVRLEEGSATARVETGAIGGTGADLSMLSGDRADALLSRVGSVLERLGETFPDDEQDPS